MRNEHEPQAWQHEEDPARVISAIQKAQALRDGGASASSVKAYSVPLVHSEFDPTNPPIFVANDGSGGGQA